MFADQNFYEAKVFLRAVADAQSNLREVAQQKNQLARYQSTSQSLVNAVNSGAVKLNGDSVQKDSAFAGLKEVKLFQFSNQIFKNYLPQLETSPDYASLKKHLNEGVAKLQSEQ